MTNDLTFIPFSQIIGQETAIRFLRRVLAGEKIPHAYLFAGISGIGKTTVAKALTQVLNCHAPVNGEACGRCRSCRQVMSGNFPDLVLVNPDGQNIKIEQIRELSRTLSFKPVSGGYRVCIVQQAEMMTDEAANAFLKTLEEPPSQNILILNVTEPLALLPTIVSRCQKILFQPISTSLIVRWLMDKKNLEEERALVLAKISEGSLGRAIRMWDNDFLENRQDSLFRLIQLPSLSADEALEMALEYAGREKQKGTRSSEKHEMNLFDLLGVWKSWYRDLLLMNVRGPAELLINSDFSHKLKNISKNLKIKNVMDSFWALDQAQRDLLRTRNLDLIMENTILTLRRLATQRE